jgi:hypothetical protein
MPAFETISLTARFRVLSKHPQSAQVRLGRSEVTGILYPYIVVVDTELQVSYDSIFLGKLPIFGQCIGLQCHSAALMAASTRLRAPRVR